MRELDKGLKDRLRDKAYLAAYLQLALQTGHAGLYLALREAVQAQQGGFAWLSKRTGLGRASLYKALSETGNPSYSTICLVMDALGVDRAVVTPSVYAWEPNMNSNINNVMDRGGAGTAYKTQSVEPKTRIQQGSAKGLTYYMAEDFNAPLEDFNEY